MNRYNKRRVESKASRTFKARREKIEKEVKGNDKLI